MAMKGNRKLTNIVPYPLNIIPIQYFNKTILIKSGLDLREFIRQFITSQLRIYFHFTIKCIPMSYV